jgi:mannose-6-phosphate isomerase-like protein (cupin superfamily)
MRLSLGRADSLTEGGPLVTATAQHPPNPVGAADVMVRLVSDVGETIENPVNGERITWVETAETTGGELLSLDLSLRPGAAVAAEHRHMRQEERFRVDAGSIALGIEGAERTVSEGEEVTVPAGVAHRWWNEGAVQATVRVELRPALDTQTFFETFFGLARDGKTNGKGIPGLLQIAVAYRDLGDSCPTLARPPAVVQRIMSALLAPLGRSMGRKAVYARYSPRHAACLAERRD